jgi:hypothetical protein
MRTLAPNSFKSNCPKKICTVKGCEKAARRRGFCWSHAHRFSRYGDPLGGGIFHGQPRAWLEAHVDYQGEDCLAWPFWRSDDGYGAVGHRKAHRIMCELAHGPAPSSRHQVAHSCGKGHEGCVNSRHLRWATPKENSADTILHGTQPHGERNGSAKLTAPEVHAIKMFGEWGFKGSEITTLANAYEVNPATIRGRPTNIPF